MSDQPRAALFQIGDFTLASGQKSRWKIECDGLTPTDWDALALMTMERFPHRFVEVVGVPRGGVPYADALDLYTDLGATSRRALVVDDVWTTGGSMQRFIDQHDELVALDSMGHLDRAVVFARNPVPEGVVALFQMATYP